MKPRLLFMNNFRENKIPERLDRHFCELGFDVDVCHAWSGEIPTSPAGYQAVFLSGSEISPWEDFSWVKDEINLVHKIAEAETPTLGVCFGAQIVPYGLCGADTIFRRDGHEIGLIDLHSTEAMHEDPIGAGLPKRFPIFSWHQDEIVSDHPEIRVLSRSNVCANHIWRHRDMPFWGVQAHPEAGNEYSKQWLDHHRRHLETAGLDLSDPAYIRGVSTPAALQMVDNFATFVLDKSGALENA